VVLSSCNVCFIIRLVVLLFSVLPISSVICVQCSRTVCGTNVGPSLTTQSAINYSHLLSWKCTLILLDCFLVMKWRTETYSA
jgi:hypothetical protein